MPSPDDAAVASLSKRARVRHHSRAMGTTLSIHVFTADDHADNDDRRAAVAVQRVVDEVERLEAMFSTFRPSSEISQVNAGNRSLLACSAEVLDVFDAATWLEHASGGAFTVHRNGLVDPAGFVKGWAAERAARFLLEEGFEDWCLTIGGDLLVHGRPGVDDEWTIAVSDPTQPGAIAGAVAIDGGAVATSGIAERGHHLWTADGSAADHWASVTVIGPSLTWADAFATTACALGAAGLAWVEQFEGYHAIGIRHDGALEQAA